MSSDCFTGSISCIIIWVIVTNDLHGVAYSAIKAGITLLHMCSEEQSEPIVLEHHYYTTVLLH